jgi:YidC/Oxa1 family membrane protein insertase
MNEVFEGLAQVLAWLYDFTRSYGLSIILLTLAVRIIVTPLTIKGTRSMMSMQKYQPEIKRLQQEHKGDRQKLNEEMLKFYREKSINPMGSCLPLLIQIPVFLVLYRVVHGLTRFGADGTFDPQYLNHSTALYQSLDSSKSMMFLGIDLAKSAAGTLRDDSIVQALPYLLIIAIVTGTSYIQQKQVSGRNPGMDINPMQKNLMRIMPLTFAVFAFSFPAALGLYFVTSNTYQVGQQWYISRALYGLKGKRPPGDGSADDGETTPVSSGGASPKGAVAKGSTAAGGTKAGSNGANVQGSGTRRNAAGKPAGGQGAKAGRGGNAGGSGSGNRRAENKGSAAKTRPTSGRVTEPKRNANGRATPRSSGATNGSTPNRPAPRPTGQSNGRRRTPFGSPPASEESPGDPQKKRRR